MSIRAAVFETVETLLATKGEFTIKEVRPQLNAPGIKVPASGTHVRTSVYDYLKQDQSIVRSGYGVYERVSGNHFNQAEIELYKVFDILEAVKWTQCTASEMAEMKDLWNRTCGLVESMGERLQELNTEEWVSLQNWNSQEKVDRKLKFFGVKQFEIRWRYIFQGGMHTVGIIVGFNVLKNIQTSLFRACRNQRLKQARFLLPFLTVVAGDIKFWIGVVFFHIGTHLFNQTAMVAAVLSLVGQTFAEQRGTGLQLFSLPCVANFS